MTGELVKRFGSGQTRDVASVFVCVAASRMDNMRARLAVMLVVGVCSIREVVWGQCTKTGPCTCQTSSGFVDLTPLASSSGSPKLVSILIFPLIHLLLFCFLVFVCAQKEF